MLRLLSKAIVGLCCVFGATITHAQSLGFEMTGDILPPTCRWAVGDDNRSIQLDAIDLRDLPASGAAGHTPFQLVLEGCSAGVTQVVFAFSGNVDISDTYRYRNIGSAMGMAMELQSSDGRTLRADGSDSTRTVAVSADRAALDLRVAYWRLDGQQTSSGTVIAVAQVVMTYQ